MKKKVNLLLGRAFMLTFILSIYGGFLIYNRADYSALFFALTALVIYISIGIYEVRNSNKLTASEKNLWIIGFIFFSFFTAIYYLAIARKNIV